MPNQNKTELVCILDRSGSMEFIRSSAEEGFNSFLREQEKVAGQEVRLTLVQFDTVYEMLYDNVVLDGQRYRMVPRGGTALHDAIGKTINSVGQRLRKMHETERPGKVIVMIVTDGQENSSHEFSSSMIKDMVEHQTSKYSWEFMYIGANQDAAVEGGRLGIMNTMNYEATDMGTRSAYCLASAAAVKYRKTGTGIQLPTNAEEATNQ